MSPPPPFALAQRRLLSIVFPSTGDDSPVQPGRGVVPEGHDEVGAATQIHVPLFPHHHFATS